MAVALVVGVHVQNVLVPGSALLEAGGPLPGGFLGVDVFFVLSGFLITSVLLRERLLTGRVLLRSFYQRRAVRLLPALLVLLAAHWLYALATGLPMRPEWLSTRAAALYVSNWTWYWDGLVAAPGLGHLWSLAIEEQFYLAWPLLLLGFQRSARTRRLIPAAIGLAILVVVLHRADEYADGTNIFFLYQRTDTRVDGLLVGAGAAVLRERWPVARRPMGAAAWAATVVVAGTVMHFSYSDAPLYRGWFTIFALAVAVIVLAAVNGTWAGARVLERGALTRLGRVSYGLYLWHLPVFYAVVRYGAGWSVAVRIVVALGISMVATASSWLLVERPATQVFRRRTSARSRAPSVSAPARFGPGSAESNEPTRG